MCDHEWLTVREWTQERTSDSGHKYEVHMVTWKCQLCGGLMTSKAFYKVVSI
jgi:hypothetical protein